jgi:hypothetical protein
MVLTGTAKGQRVKSGRRGNGVLGACVPVADLSAGARGFTPKNSYCTGGRSQ